MIERVILAAIFYIFVTPIALILKFCKVDLLRLKIDDNQESYWIKSKGTEIVPVSKVKAVRIAGIRLTIGSHKKKRKRYDKKSSDDIYPFY